MIGAGTFISPLIKVITTVAILAAVYFFIVKPTLDTTNKAFESVGNIPGLDEDTFDVITPQIQKSIRQAQKLADQQIQASSQQTQQAEKLLDCVSDANNDADKIANCHQKFSP